MVDKIYTITGEGVDQACTASRIVVQQADLPLSCPPRDDRVWDAHPRVYLPIEEALGKIDCPYCGTEYVLKDFIAPEK